MKHLQICDFTVPELGRFRELCNFTPDELEFFNLRSRDKSIVEISLIMNISESKASVLSSKVKKKIIKIL